MTTGQKIKQRRLELQLTQRELAARLGYTDHTTLTRIESGKTDLPQSRLVQVAQVLGVPPSYLIDAEQPEDIGKLAARVAADPTLIKLVRNYLLLDQADQRTVDSLLESLAANKKSRPSGRA